MHPYNLTEASIEQKWGSKCLRKLKKRKVKLAVFSTKSTQCVYGLDKKRSKRKVGEREMREEVVVSIVYSHITATLPATRHDFLTKYYSQHTLDREGEKTERKRRQGEEELVVSSTVSPLLAFSWPSPS